MKIAYVHKNFSAASLKIIVAANKIIAEYQQAGYTLTLRQLYYQFVSRDLLPNTVAEYKRLGNIVNDGRMAGYIDWEAIEDRTRNLKRLPTWQSPADIVAACAKQYRSDRWDSQPYRVEVWVEKEALAGVFEHACNKWHVPFFCCRGYTSASEMWSAAQRFIEYTDHGQQVVVLHFGDHDPSGIDMSRDIKDRLAVFGADVQFERCALNMDQIDKYNPPPNPAKTTDARFVTYEQQFGTESWELDALEPSVLDELVTGWVQDYLDEEAWEAACEADEVGRAKLKETAQQLKGEVG